MGESHGATTDPFSYRAATKGATVSRAVLVQRTFILNYAESSEIHSNGRGPQQDEGHLYGPGRDREKPDLVSLSHHPPGHSSRRLPIVG